MGRLSREKGKDFEQRVARDILGVLPKATVHRSSQADRAYEPDVVITADAPLLAKLLWLECQDSRQPAPLEKLAQAERDTAHLRVVRLPVVVWHRTAARAVYATMRNETWMRIVGAHYWLRPRLFVGAVHGSELDEACSVPYRDKPPTFTPPALPHAGIPITLDWDQLLFVLQTLEPTAAPKETSP